MNKEYLIIIPARGGSKGITDKNILDISGKPLIAYSIKTALDALTAGVKGEAIVSTDSDKIAQVAREWGASVPFMRPAGISGDKSKSVEFVLHALGYFAGQNRTFDAVIILQPTSPLRSVQDVLQAVEIFESTGHQSLITAYREDYICDLVSYKIEGNTAHPVNPMHNAGIRRQEHDKLYVRNGAIYITGTEYIRGEQKVICDTPAVYVMPKSRSVNLDTLDDLEYLRWHLR